MLKVTITKHELLNVPYGSPDSAKVWDDLVHAKMIEAGMDPSRPYSSEYSVMDDRFTIFQEETDAHA